MGYGRALRLQPYNVYRRALGLRPAESFSELTGGDEELASSLQQLYGDVDAVEFIVGEEMIDHGFLQRYVLTNRIIPALAFIQNHINWSH